MRNRITLLAAALCLSAAAGGAAMVQSAFVQSAFAQSATTTLSGVYTEAQATRGQGQFATDCAPCHGSTAQGNGEAPALTGPEFTADWIGLPLGDLFHPMQTTMAPDR